MSRIINASSFTLDDFRNVLGKVNDGNVMPDYAGRASDNSMRVVGIHKANYGFFNRCAEANSESANVIVRTSFYEAIENSDLADAVPASVLKDIRKSLGLGPGAEEGKVKSKLMRGEIKSILDRLDSEAAKFAAETAKTMALDESMSNILLCDLNSRDRMLLFKARSRIETAVQLADVDRQMELLPPEGFLGHSAAEMRTFLKSHGPKVAARLFENLFWEARTDKCQSETEIGRCLSDRLQGGTRFAEAFQKAAREVLESFAKENPKPLTTAKDRYIEMSGFPDYMIVKPEDTAFAKDEKNPDKCKNVEEFKNGRESFCDSFDRLLGLMNEAVKKDSVSSVDVYLARTALLKLRDDMYAAFSNNVNRESNEAAMRLVQDIMFELTNHAASPELGIKALARLFAGDRSQLEMLQDDLFKDKPNVSPYGRLKSAFEAFRKTYDTRGCVWEIIETYCEKNPVLKDDVGLVQQFIKKIERDLRSDVPVDKGSPVWKLRRDVDALSRTLFRRNGLYEDTLSVQKQEGILVDNIKDGIATLAASFLQGVKDDDETRKKTVNEINEVAATLAADLGFENNLEHEGLLKLAGVFVGSETAKTMNDEQLLACLVKEPPKLRALAASYLKAGLDVLDGCIRKNNPSSPMVFRNMVFDGQIDPSGFSSTSVNSLLRFLASARDGDVGGYTWPRLFSPPGVDTVADVTPYREYYKLLPSRLDGIDSKLAEELRQVLRPEDYQTAEVKASDVDEVKAVLESSMPALASNFNINSLEGFPTTDMGEIMRLFVSCGIAGPALDTFEGREKVAILMRCSRLNPTGMKDLKAYCEGVFGKPFANVTLVDMAKLDTANLFSPAEQMGDPKQLATWNFLSGNASLAELKVSGASALALADAARELAKPGVTSVEVANFNGTAFSLQKAEDGSIVAVLKDVTLKSGEVKQSLRMPVALDLLGLRLTAENELVAHAKEFQQALRNLLTGLPDPPLPGTVERSRELYTKTIKAFVDVPDVVFSGLTTEQLREKAFACLAGEKPVLEGKPNEQYMSATAVELHKSLVEYRHENPGQLRTIVHLPSVSGVRTQAQRNEKIEPGDVRNLIADLFMNADTWDLDEAALGGHRSQGGERLRRLLRTYGPELAYLSEDGRLAECLADLPDVVRGEVQPVLERIIELRKDDPLFVQDATQEALSQIDDRLAKIADSVMGKMQKTITDDYFKAKAPDQRPVTEKTFAELAGGEGLNLQTTSGRFAKTVLDGYFSHAKTIDKRKWLSALVLNTKKGDPMNRQVAELLKGAGPMLQKILQGLPIESFNVETQEALKDMKSRLPPIPEEAVRAQMLECVRASGGRILSIEVKKSLGAASVAQAFLCNIKTPEHPVSGVDCVIKVLRPTAAPAIGREKAVIDELLAASKDPMIGAIKADFESRYASVLEELDFTLEAQNVDLGIANYDQPVLNFGGGKTLRCDHVHSMHRVKGLAPSPGAMVVELAPGVPMDRFLENADRELDGILRVGQPDSVKVVTAAEPGGVQTTAYVAKNVHDLCQVSLGIGNQRNELLSRRAKLNELVKAWFDRALFGDGFFHGDMHAGNVMIDANGVTVIDFGNCTRMTAAERDQMLSLIIAATSGDAKRFLADLGVKNPPAELVNEIADVFAKGSGLSALERIEGAFTVLQGNNVTIPSVCSGFISSLTRLSGIISALDAKIQRCDDILSMLHTAPVPLPDLRAGGQQGPGNPGQPPPIRMTKGGKPDVELPSLFTALERAFAATPVTKKSLEAALKPYSATDRIYDFFSECGGDIGQIIRLVDWLASRFGITDYSVPPDPSEDRIGNAIFRVRKNLELLNDDNGNFDDYWQQEGGLGTLHDQEEEKNLTPEAARDYRKEKLKGMVSRLFFGTVARDLPALFSRVGPKDGITLESQGDFFDQVGDIIGKRGKDCVAFLYRKFDAGNLITFSINGGVSYASAMVIGTEKGAQASVREADALELIRDLNNGKPAADQVSSLDITTIRKTIKDFYAPQTCVYRSTKSTADLVNMTATITDSPVSNWGAKAENRKMFLKALDYNMMRLEKAFGGKLQAKHWQFALALYSECETSVFGASMIGAVKAMKSKDYDALLLEAQRMDLPGNPRLSTALSFMQGYERPEPAVKQED